MVNLRIKLQRPEREFELHPWGSEKPLKKYGTPKVRLRKIPVSKTVEEKLDERQRRVMKGQSWLCGWGEWPTASLTQSWVLQSSGSQPGFRGGAQREGDIPSHGATSANFLTRNRGWAQTE